MLNIAAQTIDLTGFYAGVNMAPLLCDKVASPIVNGETDIVIVSRACNFPNNNNVIVGKNYGVPYCLIQSLVNVIMSRSQTVSINEKSDECDDKEMH